MAGVSALGCSSTFYGWGEYEDLVYEMYVEPGKADPPTQGQKLSAAISEAHARGKRVPPGVNAHLGYMYYLTGDADKALARFEAERTQYPESAVLIDRLMNAMTGKAKPAEAPKGDAAD